MFSYVVQMGDSIAIFGVDWGSMGEWGGKKSGIYGDGAGWFLSAVASFLEESDFRLYIFGLMLSVCLSSYLCTVPAQLSRGIKATRETIRYCTVP